jgi:type IV pilus assembly protein PilM
MKTTSPLYIAFAKIFPPPRFLEMPIVGFDISDHGVRFVELQRHGHEFKLKRFGMEKIPPGIIEDGFINKKEELIKILASVKEKYGLQFVRASLPEEKSYLFRTEIPMMDESEIRDAIKFKIEENVPVTIDKAVFDYRILRTPKPEDKTLFVSVTVVHTHVVSNYLDAFRGAGLSPLSLQVESQAVAHAAIPRSTEGTYIVIALRENRTVLSIVSDNEVQFTSTLHVGGETIADSIKKNLEISDDEVDRIRKGKEVRESNEMFLSLVSAATALRDKVQKLITYWENHSEEHGHDHSIDSVIISGSDAMLGLDDYLARSLDLKVKLANPWVNILTMHEDVPALTLREALDYLPALGLALPYD